MMSTQRPFVTCIGPASVMILLWMGVAFGKDGPTYNRDVRPILADACFACHGPDSAARQADLRLDVREQAVDRGAIDPGAIDSSEMIRRIFAMDPSEVMPPPETHKTLTDEQKQTLVEWIKAGAEYEPHWSYLLPRAPDLPETRKKDWVRNAIDRFILSKLETVGLEPAPEADLRQLARRVSLDLTGLPPSPQEVDELIMDARPDAYERYVDRLLQTDAWAEHRARYWLDYARYADTHGIHFDNYREVWAYRDWVIDAFRRNMPFDQFSIEQIAGDLLPNPSLDQRIATGFHRCNITTNEGGVIEEEYKVLYTRDRTETVAQVWLGMTAGCGVCHDHKFDPLSQREFYELSAFFNNTTQGGLDGNRKDTPPIVAVPRVEDRQRYQQLDGLIGAARQEVESLRAIARNKFNDWIVDSHAVAATREQFSGDISNEHLLFHLPLTGAEEQGLPYWHNGQWKTLEMASPPIWKPGFVAKLAWQNQVELVPTWDDLGDFEFDQPFSVSLWVKLENAGQGGALLARMDEANAYRGWDVWLEGGRVGMHIIHAWQQNALKVVANTPLSVDRWHHVAISYDGSRKSGGIEIHVDGVRQEVGVQADSLTETIRTQVPLALGRRSQGAHSAGALVQDVRIYGGKISPEIIQRLKVFPRAEFLLSNEPSKASEQEKNELFDWYLENFDTEFVTARNQMQALEREKAQIEARGTIAHVTEERSEPAKAFVLYRGEYDQRRDEVNANTPQFLPPFPDEFPRNRLGFARWLFQPGHPLTSRVTVNRFWQEVFGTGLVATSGDFGVAGQLPSHPELLDYLALQFEADHYDVRQLFRMMVTSATYRQSSVVTAEKLQLDPENRLLSRGPRYRMDAEMLRDMALAASGLLSRKIGGPSVKPYQPPGVWEAVAMPESNTRNYQEDQGENLYRRSMYTFWKRAAPPASMEILNAPNRETCTVRRERTNTPLQALLVLNDPQFVEAARNLAQKVLLNCQEESAMEFDRVQCMALYLLARPLSAEEMCAIQQSLPSLTQFYRAHPEEADRLLAVGKSPVPNSLDRSELATWSMVANILMNLDEVLCK